jgi:L-arabinose isomerase
LETANRPRLVFEGRPGPAVLASLIDMGGRMRLIGQDIAAGEPVYKMPNLPVARNMWKPMPDLMTGAEAWITAGGAHHPVLSFDVSAEQLRDWARIQGIEFVHIDADTRPDQLERELFLSDLAWKLG